MRKETIGRLVLAAGAGLGASEVRVVAQEISEGPRIVWEGPPTSLERLYFSSPPAWEKLTKNLNFHLCWGDRSRPEVVLTIDDANYLEITYKNFKFLLENNIPVTFFPTGDSLKAYPDFWREVIRFYPVCNHTLNHRYLAQLSEEEIGKEIDGWEKIAAEVLGEDYLKMMKAYFPFFRLPYASGNSDPRVLRTVIKKGYVPIGWSVQAWDIAVEGLKTKDVAGAQRKVVKRVEDWVGNGAIILLHATEWETGNLNEVVEQVQKKGYRFVTLNRALGLENQLNDTPKKWRRKLNKDNLL